MKRETLPAGARRVVATAPIRGGAIELTLDCGHSVRRRFGLCVPERVLCPDCARAASAAREARMVEEGALGLADCARSGAPLLGNGDA